MLGSAPNPRTNQNVVRFGLFELNLRAGELRKSGIRIKLQEQPFQILAMLLERPGEIVTREELQKRLWPQDTFVDFDLSLNSAVKKLRQALGDDSENPRFIETLYRRGYRFIGQTNGAPAVEAPATPQQVLPPSSQGNVVAHEPAAKTRKINLVVLAWIIPALLIVIAALVWFTRPSPPPRILGYTQITHDGLRKLSMVTDSERLYIEELQGDHFGISQVSVNGGESSAVPIPFANSFAADIASDGSALLVTSFKGTEGPAALWSVPLPTGSPQRLNDSSGEAAAWSGDRSRIVFAHGPDIYAAHGNGSQPRKLATISGSVSGLRFSPDGRRIRFDVLDPKTGFTAIWEIYADGSHLRPLLPGWNETPRECCGNWTPDGKYYIFQSLRDGKTNLWFLPEQAHSLTAAKPEQLTNGPLDFSFPVASKDGKRIFAVGSQPRTELVRYNGQSGFTSYLGGISATDLAFSSDGQFVAYISVPEGTLWRSKADGSQRLQLTEPALQAALPRWSPDGKQIVFMGRTMNTNWRAYLIASDGGATHDLLPSATVGFDPTWSPDGRSVVLTLNEAGESHDIVSGPGVTIVDVQTKKISPLPHAERFFSPRCSPDGKFIAALSIDSQKLVLFDRAIQQWTDLVTMPIGYPSWSHDGRYLYFDTTLTDDAALFRVRVSDRKLERLASLKGLRRFWGQFASWTGLAPDDSFLLVRDTSSQEIYALDWQVP
jgi:Tol biopolymer transport system component/DNA-binding winged helix-turn-helix (wHTH) protein